MTTLLLTCYEGPEGKPCTMIVRRLHWILPHFWIWGVPFFMFYSTRSAQFLHQTPNQGLLKTLVRFLLSPMVNKLNKYAS
ncbi:putative flavin-containing monooxygenase [Medicago truncatula]|uniref:Putative flavin-containing monooxygenase n=1 Tax=Medicago truncatula TaxID=3880 RepID=A0A396J745_MEDTR|nr:putative flavin-containing monooxygenase [Medicago truncatula]